MSRIIYLDNAATSWPKPKNVINAVKDSFIMCGNPGRSGHELSLYSAKAVYVCREAICSFFNFSNPENVIFTYNTTYALNLAIKGLMENDGEIVISNLEHNSVIRPVMELKKQNPGISVIFFDALCDDECIISNFKNSLSDKTRLCVITMCSNVTGKIMPYRQIGEICRKKGIKLIFDAAQLAGLYPIDLSSLYFSAVCFAGHKSLYGIMGSGFCIFSKEVEPKTIIEGGNGTMSVSTFQSGDLPERLESGTMGVPGIIALHEGIKHINTAGLSYIGEKCAYLENMLSSRLSDMNNIKIYSNVKNKVSTILFNIDGVFSETVASLLSEKGICVRSGLHCAPLCHKALGTLETGAVRVSISHFNSREDVEEILSGVGDIVKNYSGTSERSSPTAK